MGAQPADRYAGRVPGLVSDWYPLGVLGKHGSKRRGVSGERRISEGEATPLLFWRGTRRRAG